jgi:hypothetical protein
MTLAMTNLKLLCRQFLHLINFASRRKGASPRFLSQALAAGCGPQPASSPFPKADLSGYDGLF